MSGILRAVYFIVIFCASFVVCILLFATYFAITEPHDQKLGDSSALVIFFVSLATATLIVVGLAISRAAEKRKLKELTNRNS
jgi:low temperature requirement protein LtrA